MCNNECYISLIIKQIYCQNGNRRTEYITLNNLSTNMNVNLNFGYSLILNNISPCNISFTLRDSIFSIPDQVIKINCNSCKMISLPAQNGTFRFYIIAVCKECCTNN